MKLYRYEDYTCSGVEIDPGGGEHYYSTPIQVQCLEFEVTKETEHGHWIDDVGKRWVSKTSKKRYAHPTKEWALRAFIIRKERCVHILETRMHRQREALELAKRMVTTENMAWAVT